MVKGVIVAVGVAIVLLLAGPFALGMLAETNMREQLERMDASNPTYSLAVREFDRGWFSSDVTVDILPGDIYLGALSMEDPMIGAIVDQLRAPVAVELAHGPVLLLNGFGIGSYAVRAQLDSDVDWVTTVSQTLGVPYLVEMRGRAGFLTGFDFEGEVPPFVLVEQDSSMDFSGLVFSGHTDGVSTEFDAAAEQFSVQSMLLSFVLEGLGATGTFEHRPGHVATGDGGFYIERLAASNPLLGAEALVSADELKMAGSTLLNDAGNLDYAVTYEAGRFSVQNAPEFTGVAVGIEFRNLDYGAYQRLLEVLYDPIVLAEPTVLEREMHAFAHSLFSAGLGVSVDPLEFSMDGEQFDGSLELTLAAGAAPANRSLDTLSPDVLLNALSGTLEITASKALIRELTTLGLHQQLAAALVDVSEDEIAAQAAAQADQAIAMVVAQGMIVDDGETYSTVITYENGIATVNETPIPLGAMGLF